MTLKLRLPIAKNLLEFFTLVPLSLLLLLQTPEVVSSSREIALRRHVPVLRNPELIDRHRKSGFRRLEIAQTDVGEPNLEDVQVLLDVKAEFTNGEKVLTDWKNTSAAAACNWTAVTCGGPKGNRVVELNLGDLELTGSVPPSVCNLQFLQHLNLSFNDLTGSIPSFLGNCTHLVYLNLRNNQLGGEIPYFGDPSTTFRELEIVNFGVNHLTGPIPEWFGDYSSLTTLTLRYNQLTGGIPSKFAQLSNLTLLNLSWNKLSGRLNPLIANCSALVYLVLDLNHFHGPIPSELGALQNLEGLYLGTNDFTGQVTVEILTNCTKMQDLSLENNELTGEIPPEIGRLQALEILYIRGNNLTGKIPVSLSNCTILSWLSLDDNQLVGNVPWELGLLKTLTALNLWNNNLNNILPESLANCTNLYRLMFGRDDGIVVDGQSMTPQPFPPWMSPLVNMSVLELMTVGLYGPIPAFVSNFTQLAWLDLRFNNLTGPIPDALGNLTQLQSLCLTSNQLTGQIPNSIGNLSYLGNLYLDDNRLEGPIPSAVENLTFLTVLVLDSNELSGEIPSELSFWSKLNLTKISLRGNKFNGTIRSAFRNQYSLEVLDVSSNKLTGPIPSVLGTMTPLLNELILSENQLNGTIPIDLFKGSTGLIKVQLQKNVLSGTIPQSIGNLTDLLLLDLSNNDFSGTIPSFGNMTSLTNLNLSWNQFSGLLPLDLPKDTLVTADLSHNKFSGPLPSTLSSLQGLTYLDLSSNSFSGTIPAGLGQLLSLTYFNVSFNELEGPIPTTGFFASLNLTGAFLGNSELCGALVARNCSSESSIIRDSGGCKGFECKGVVIGVISGGSALLLLVVVFISLWCLCYRCRGAPREIDAAIRLNFPRTEKVLKLSAEDLKIATYNFDPEYLIGEGAGTKVYKFVLPESDEIYAAKVLHSGPALEKYEKLLLEEVRAMSKLRHRNVLRVVGYCSNDEIKAAILDYMPNGSLHNHLYGESLKGNLSWETRLNISIGIAQGLVYLHTEFPEPIIHRDLKPMNILLDNNLEAKICDLGLGKFVEYYEAGEASATVLCGTIGYIAPEYTTSTRVSTKGDVYAYGIIVLELLTARQPTEKSFSGAENIVAWAQNAQTSDSFEDILDPTLFSAVDRHRMLRQAALLLHVALLCCQFSPQSRPSMRDVLGMLLQINRAENTENVAIEAN